jgi:hypothetical protein
MSKIRPRDHKLVAGFLMYEIEVMDKKLEKARLNLRKIYNKKKKLVEDYNNCLEQMSEVVITSSSRRR